MTFVFLFILILNCLVIFAADALLGTPAPSITTTTTVIALNGTSAVLPAGLSQNVTLALTQAERLYAADGLSSMTNGSEKRSKVVGRKGVSEEFGNSETTSSTTNGESLFGWFNSCIFV